LFFSKKLKRGYESMPLLFLSFVLIPSKPFFGWGLICFALAAAFAVRRFFWVLLAV
jgi:hypothetical protein